MAMYPDLIELPSGTVVSSYPVVYVGAALLYLGAAFAIGRRYRLRNSVAFDLTALYLLGMTALACFTYDIAYGEPSLRGFTLGGLLQGGLVGGAGLVLILFVGYVWLCRLGPQVLDVACLALPAGLAGSKVACLLHGCCYGTPYRGFLAILTADGPVHPTQVYDLVWLAVVGLALWVFSRTGSIERGWVGAWFVLLFCCGRMMTDFLRGDTAGYEILGRITGAQVVYLAGMALSAGAILAAPGPYARWVARMRERASQRPRASLRSPEARQRAGATSLDVLGAVATAAAAAALGSHWELGVWLWALLAQGLCVAVLGASPGMLLFGLQVRRASGRHVGHLALLRAVAWGVSLFTVTGMVSGWVDGSGRSLHDAVSGVTVTPRASRSASAATAPADEVST